MTNISVIPAAHENLDEITVLFKKAIDLMNSTGIPQWDDVYPNRTDFEEDINKGEMFACMIANKIAAVYVINTEYDSDYANGKWQYPNSRFCVFHRLCVHSEFQNMGLGKRVVTLAEAHAKRIGFESVRLDAFSQNPYALRVYEKLGYIKVGEANFRKGLFYLYEKTL